MSEKDGAKPTRGKTQRPPPWKPDEVLALVEAVKPYADKFMQYVKDRDESERVLTELAARQDWRIALVALAFLAGIVLTMSYLSLLGRVSGDALLFLVGTITGYIFSLIFKFRVWPVQREEVEE